MFLSEYTISKALLKPFAKKTVQVLVHLNNLLNSKCLAKA